MDVKIVKTWRNSVIVLNKKMTVKELSEAADKNGILKANLEFDFSSIITNDIEWLNDEVSEKITGSIVGLTDISYKITCAKKSTNTVVVEVTGDVSDFLVNDI